jgi:hypothetical protein
MSTSIYGAVAGELQEFYIAIREIDQIDTYR